MGKDNQVLSGNLSEKKEKAKKKQKDSGLRDLTASLSIEGMPQLTADKVINIKDVAGIHVGKWYINKITHNISKSGYITTAELQKNATQKPNTAFGQNASPTIQQQMQAKNNPTTTPKQVPRYDQYGKVIKT